MNTLLTRKGALWAGLIFVIVGIVLLFWTNPILGWLTSWWPLILMVTGVFLWYKVLAKMAQPRYMFSGTVFFLVGLQLQLLSLGFFTLSQSWPGFATSIGLALIPYALRFNLRTRVNLLIPAFALLALSVIFFTFTMKLWPENYNFSAFATQWWPLVFILFGIALLFSYYYRKPGNEE